MMCLVPPNGDRHNTAHARLFCRRRHPVWIRPVERVASGVAVDIEVADRKPDRILLQPPPAPEGRRCQAARQRVGIAPIIAFNQFRIVEIIAGIHADAIGQPRTGPNWRTIPARRTGRQRYLPSCSNSPAKMCCAFSSSPWPKPSNRVPALPKCWATSWASRRKAAGVLTTPSLIP